MMPSKTTLTLFVALFSLIPACSQNVNAELLEAAKSGRTERIKGLLDAGADVNTKDPDGFTPLKWAVVRGHAATVQVLLDGGADLNMRDSRDQTPLMIATEEDLTRIITLLKQAGAKE